MFNDVLSENCPRDVLFFDMHLLFFAIQPAAVFCFFLICLFMIDSDCIDVLRDLMGQFLF